MFPACVRDYYVTYAHMQSLYIHSTCAVWQNSRLWFWKITKNYDWEITGVMIVTLTKIDWILWLWMTKNRTWTHLGQSYIFLSVSKQNPVHPLTFFHTSISLLSAHTAEHAVCFSCCSYSPPSSSSSPSSTALSIFPLSTSADPF